MTAIGALLAFVAVLGAVGVAYRAGDNGRGR